MVSLNAKSYYGWNDTDPSKDKKSSKGLNKSLMLTKDDYLNVLKSRTSEDHVNRGFIYKNYAMFSYEMKKRGLIYTNAKRIVDDNGFSTTNLDL